MKIKDTPKLKQSDSTLLAKGFRLWRATGFQSLLSESLGYISRKIDPLASRDYPTLAGRFNSKTLFANLNPNAAFSGRTTYILTDQEIEASSKACGLVISSLDNLTGKQISESAFYVYFLCDSDALPLIRKIISFGGVFIPHMNASKTTYRFINRLALKAMIRTWSKADRVSHLLCPIHENICEALYITRDLEGDYVEIGVYKGGSALTAINFIDELYSSGVIEKKRRAWLLDTFDGFTYEEARVSSDAQWTDTHKLWGVDKTIAYIRETIAIASQSVESKFVASNICSDDLPNEITKVCVANVDVDMYEPTLQSLKKISPLIVSGGIIICEDPASTPALYGALVAMEDFLGTAEGKGYLKVFKGGQYFLIKTSR